MSEPRTDREALARRLARVTWGERGVAFIDPSYKTHIDGTNTVREHYLRLADEALAALGFGETP